jgi:hypothetical protein
MVQLYDKLPPDFMDGGMIKVDNGEYCKSHEAQRILNKAYAQIEFLIAPSTQKSGTTSLYRKLPAELDTITNGGSVFCNARDTQRLLNKAHAHIEFLLEHIQYVDATPEERAIHKPVRC